MTAEPAPAPLPARFARLVKIEHTVFALPFAYVGAFLAVNGIAMEQLATKERILEPTYVTIDPFAGAEESYQHEGEEFVFVLAGHLEVTIEERETHRLGEGDSITFPSHRPHRWRNPGDAETRLIWVNTPPTF